MEKINLPAEFKKDFLSADGKTALSGLGYIFNVGDYVTHINEDSNEEALIKQFGRDLVHQEIYAVTDLGSAPLVSLKKFESVNNFMEISNMEDNILVVIDNGNYTSPYAEEVPFRALLISKAEHEVKVKSLETGKIYELYYSQILESCDIETIRRIINLENYY